MRTRNAARQDALRAGRLGFFLAALGACCFLAPSRAAAEGAVPAASTATAAGADDEDVYVYNAPSRDPFIPLSGGAAPDVGSAAPEAMGTFNPSSVELKGIIRTRIGRWAVLAGSGGERYVVENGKIRDAKKKPVEGFVGIIKEKTLVLIGPNNQVTELKLKKDQTAEDKTKPKK